MAVVLVCGGRAFNNAHIVNLILDRIHKMINITKIVDGAAKGADHLATLWARENQIPYQEYPAQWFKYGNAAGSIRNEEMIVSETVNLVVAFPGGSGTADMVKRAKHHPIEVVEVRVIDGKVKPKTSFPKEKSILFRGDNA